MARSACCPRGNCEGRKAVCQRMAPLSPKNSSGWIRHWGIGVEYAAAVAGLALMGWWIDEKFDTSPAGVLIGAGLGLIGATYNLVRASLAAFKDMDKREHDGGDGADN